MASEDQQERLNNPNYHAFLRDLAELRKKGYRGLVAYCDGKMIATGKEIEDLAADVPDNYKGHPLFVEKVSQGTIPNRPAIHLIIGPIKMTKKPATFGQYITNKRKEKGLTLRQCAAKILKEDGEAISFQYLSELENDRRNPPADYMIEQFANVFGISAGILYIKAHRFPESFNTDDEERVARAWKVLIENN